MAAQRSILVVALIWLRIVSIATCLSVTSIDLTYSKGRSLPSLIDVTIDELAEGLENGLFTSVDLVNAYLGRISQVNNTLSAVAEVNPDALSIAADLDASRSNGIIKGPSMEYPFSSRTISRLPTR
ncbi:amidase [Colletotrichum tofieldiae]|nr:amidase [Colletotrichum tofieldiae]